MANLQEVRKDFVRVSGRYDLVGDTQDYADAGADFYIRAGQNYLDDNSQASFLWVRRYFSLEKGERAFVVPPHIKIGRPIWVSGGTPITRCRLSLLTLESFREKYVAEDIIEGRPLDIFITTGKSEDQFDADISETDLFGVDNFGGEIISLGNETPDFSTAFIGPKADGSYTVEIPLRLRSASLGGDDGAGENTWTRRYPEVLIAAAMRSLNIFYGNTQRSQHYEAVINGLLLELGIREVDSEGDNAPEFLELGDGVQL